MLTKVNSVTYLKEKETYKLLTHITEIYINLDCISNITIHPVDLDHKFVTSWVIVRMVDGYSFAIDETELELILSKCNPKE